MNLRRAAEFWILADAQMGRNRGEEIDDEVLCRLLPAPRPPWGRSWCARAVTSVPAEFQQEFVVAYHWLGDDTVTGSLILPMFQRGDATRHTQLEDRGSLAMLGAITLPKSAPWRKRPWAGTVGMIPPLASRAPTYHARLSVVYQDDAAAARVMRDLRQDHWGAWTWLSDRAIRGLGWVLHDGTERRTTETEAYAVLDQLLASRPAGQDWTPDDVVAWAEFCSEYVDAYRKKW